MLSKTDFIFNQLFNWRSSRQNNHPVPENEEKCDSRMTKFINSQDTERFSPNHPILQIPMLYTDDYTVPSTRSRDCEPTLSNKKFNLEALSPTQTMNFRQQ